MDIERFVLEMRRGWKLGLLTGVLNKWSCARPIEHCRQNPWIIPYGGNQDWHRRLSLAAPGKNRHLNLCSSCPNSFNPDNLACPLRYGEL